MGTVGEDRFKEGAVAGTYWGATIMGGDEVTVKFDVGGSIVEERALAGENILRVAERCGVIVPDLDFCYEGTCCHCEIEVKGGAPEVGYRAEPQGGDLVRSCICPVPAGRDTVQVKVLSEEDAWGDGVL